MKKPKLIWIKSIDVDGYLMELHSAGFAVNWKYVDSQYRFILEYKGKDVFYIDTGEELQRKAWVIGGDACKAKAGVLCKQYNIHSTKFENE